MLSRRVVVVVVVAGLMLPSLFTLGSGNQGKTLLIETNDNAAEDGKTIFLNVHRYVNILES